MPNSTTALRISGLIGLGGSLISIANNGPTKSNMGVAFGSSSLIFNEQIKNTIAEFANRQVLKLIYGKNKDSGFKYAAVRLLSQHGGEIAVAQNT